MKNLITLCLTTAFLLSCAATQKQSPSKENTNCCRVQLINQLKQQVNFDYPKVVVKSLDSNLQDPSIEYTLSFDDIKAGKSTRLRIFPGGALRLKIGSKKEKIVIDKPIIIKLTPKGIIKENFPKDFLEFQLGY